ncbi:P-loop containing nucleoside triphosphate hydrolase protein [Zopfia rhizophila CBS 207.26]|uniref:P-loop containing nucleoside triphosphate hydrolase protein n=1 Tax=Zopfia rhizophila CBS 207.26 TaxID=1314779 RepID=A0A6A6E527_9PEZI|nr:P-loop containing nucleoside triphosphate hydrolase protein [Zopfia rhizophila CBS 207.26]
MAQNEPPDEQFHLLLPLKIKGYNLPLKKWLDLMADRISDVTWKQEAFKALVINRKAKNLIEALVSKQLESEKSTDPISGKGNSLILLLHGSLGTGKTLTAESVAEIVKKPLYRVTCGNVGTKAEAKEMGCVVLLDEADIFLEQRSLEDLERNALVSVFLRALEYHEGVLILTSNRVGTFDEAFNSRIQLALHYPSLGPYQCLRIWETFINRLESFDDDTIRNGITTARQYAEWKGTMLTYEHLNDVIEVSGRFDKYLDKLNGGFTQDQLVEDEGLQLA